MNAPDAVKTARLQLVRPRAFDATAIFTRYASDPDVTRFLGWPRHRSVVDSESFVVYSDAQWNRWLAGPYLIRSLEDGELIGSTGFTFHTVDRVETGYVLAKDAWGRGYATEALRAVIDVARQVGIKSLDARCHAEHLPSRRILEKCGFVRDMTWTQPIEFPNLAGGVSQPAVYYVLAVTP